MACGIYMIHFASPSLIPDAAGTRGIVTRLLRRRFLRRRRSAAAILRRRPRSSAAGTKPLAAAVRTLSAKFADQRPPCSLSDPHQRLPKWHFGLQQWEGRPGATLTF